MPTDGAARALHIDPIPEAPFYIAVTDSATRLRRTLKSGDTFVVMDRRRQVHAVRNLVQREMSRLVQQAA
jgi:hypothetical protein